MVSMVLLGRLYGVQGVKTLRGVAIVFWVVGF